jgi:transaldolase
MKLFLDTANLQTIHYWHKLGIVDGITTNPSNLAKEGGNVTELIKKICSLMPDCPVSVEVTQQDPDAVHKQAHAIAALAKNVVVKIPCQRDYYPVIKRLVEEGVQVNVTLVFTLIQSVLVAKLGAQYVSPFVGRLEEIDADGIALLNVS